MESNEYKVSQEDAKKYAELYLTMKRALIPNTYEVKQGYEECDGANITDSFQIPIGLSDEDKFICALLYIEDTDMGLTSHMLNQWFGWSKYKCYKLAKANNHCHTVSLVCEEGGYAGKGWILTREMDNSINEYIHSSYPCVKCSKLVLYEKDNYPGIRECPVGYCRYNCQIPVFKNSCCKTGFFEVNK